MAGPNRVIVGLGNPGPQYDGTRHNAGFLAAERVAQRLGIDLRESAAASLVGEGRWRGRPVAVALPQTFMNRSGEAFVALRRYYHLDNQDLLVVYDDLALPQGTIRLRPKGGAGGHNGIQDIIDHLASDEFPRLRIGIGSDFPRGGQVRYVLDPFTPDEHAVMDEALDAAAEAALTFVRDGITTAMNRHNRRA